MGWYSLPIKSPVGKAGLFYWCAVNAMTNDVNHPFKITQADFLRLVGADDYLPHWYYWAKICSSPLPKIKFYGRFEVCLAQVF